MKFVLAAFALLISTAAQANFDIVRSDFPTQDFRRAVQTHYLWRGDGFQKLALMFGEQSSSECDSLLQQYRSLALREMLRRNFLTEEQYLQLLQMVQKHDHRQITFFTARSPLKVKDRVPQDRATRKALRDAGDDPEMFLTSNEALTDDHPAAIAARAFGGLLRGTLWLVRGQTPDGQTIFSMPWHDVEFLKDHVDEIQSGIQMGWEVGSAYASEPDILKPTFEMAALTALQEATELRIPLNRAQIYMRSAGPVHTKHYMESAPELRLLLKNPKGPDSLLGVRLSDLDWNRILRERNHLVQKYFKTFPNSSQAALDVYELLNAYSRLVIEGFDLHMGPLPTPIVVKAEISVAAAVWFGQSLKNYRHWTLDELAGLFLIAINGVPQLPTESLTFALGDQLASMGSTMLFPAHGWQIEGLSESVAEADSRYAIDAVRAVYLYKLNQLKSSSPTYYREQYTAQDGVTVLTYSGQIAAQLKSFGGLDLGPDLSEQDWKEVYYPTDKLGVWQKPPSISAVQHRIYFDGPAMNRLAPKSQMEAIELFQKIESRALPR